MKLLFLAPRLPLPIDTGGKIRTYNILKQLAKNAEVTLLSFSFEMEDVERALKLNSLGIKVYTIPMQEPSLFKKLLGVTLGLTPFSISKYKSIKMEQKLINLIKENSFDAIHIDHLHMSQYIPQCQGLPCIIDEHNVEYKILERYVSVEAFLHKKIIYMDQAFKMKTFESNIIKSSTACLACSAVDQQVLENLCYQKVPIHVIPNGVDTDFFTPNKTNPLPLEDAIVFTGSMDWLPNDDAITYFCSQILPFIWRKNPAIKFYVVGKSPSTSVQKLAEKDARVIVTGRVEDVRPYVERSKVFIVPLRVGGGTRLKILEAMAMRKAVVSTSIGAEGIQYTDHQNILIGDTPEIFANHVLTLIRDSHKTLRIGHAGRTLVCDQYDWNIVGTKLKTIYQEVGNVHKKQNHSSNY